MKKALVCIALLAAVAARADEGMWLPQLLGQQKYAEMKAKGLKLTAEQLYSINKPSIKDAIVLFGSGCTAGLVSAQGLLFTNHHCGFDAIAKASTVGHNYLADGFYAKTLAEEIPAPSLSVTTLVRIDDISAQVQDSMKAYPNWADWMTARDSVLARIGRAAVEGTSYEGKVYSMFKDNQFMLYTFEKYTDIRLVGTPPQSVGKFGGDTDNWEWPRHTGDFSIFRVYTGPDGKPAPYNASNIPFKPKHFLPISLKGVKQGDFSMILGYPAGTNRFETSMGVRLATDIKNPAFVYMRDIRLKAMHEQMQKSPATKLKLASSYATLANYWKFFDGETKQLLKYDVYGTKKKQEDALALWAKNKPEYANLFNDYIRAYAAWTPYAKHKEYYEQGLAGTAPAYSNGPQGIRFANRLETLLRLLLKSGKPAEIKKEVARLDSLRTIMLAEIDKPSEQQMLWRVVKAFNSDIAADQQPVLFYNQIKQQFGLLKDEATYRLWAASVFANTFFFDDTKWKAFMANPDAGTIQADPLYVTATAFRENWKKYKPQMDAFTNSTAQLGHLYLKAWQEMNPKLAMYPDANGSMRLSFGAVKGYQPKPGVTYDFVTTSQGILEKYKPGDYEFDLPASQIDLLQKKDFGPYADALRKDMVVNFITTDDITGGNSGSPVLNASGELVGLAFDGNYEALSHKINFDKDLCRTICLDVRYLLWCVDKLGGAGNIIKELKIVKAVGGK